MQYKESPIKTEVVTRTDLEQDSFTAADFIYGIIGIIGIAVIVIGGLILVISIIELLFSIAFNGFSIVEFTGANFEWIALSGAWLFSIWLILVGPGRPRKSPIPPVENNKNHFRGEDLELEYRKSVRSSLIGFVVVSSVMWGLVVSLAFFSFAIATICATMLAGFCYVYSVDLWRDRKLLSALSSSESF